MPQVVEEEVCNTTTEDIIIVPYELRYSTERHRLLHSLARCRWGDETSSSFHSTAAVAEE